MNDQTRIDLFIGNECGRGGLIYLEDGDPVGLKIEEEFTIKAKQAGLTDEEARSAFNSNMMATGLLSESPVEFARQHGRRWLVSAYEAGDVVLHKPHTIHASTINNDPDNVIRLATDLRFSDSSKPYDKQYKYRIMASQIGNLVAAFDLAGCLDVQLVDMKGYALYQLAEKAEEKNV
ncbi:hypothetical protein Aspvir_006848 [Aspergillus viridinutans]|uniref:Uncharacterized protein n=1 Tax=Aspergillus viridinutans TaxID=75553 RepID=A0A9P3F2E4_ASPVI|nr:uncharacterized protein Aspvir_006848 [Aspergillus viridinutans]GIK02787.1 hypothetical protein Aspvir_006848 [Aspergillus viridinutans]